MYLLSKICIDMLINCSNL